jgi:carboxypeptidase T
MPYLNVDEVESALVAAAAPPNNLFTQLITLPHVTWEGRTCHAIKIANGSGASRIGVYFIGGVHAREWGSSDILVSFVEQLAQAYRTNSGIVLGSKNFAASDIQRIVNNLDIFVFPQVNADGRHYSMMTDVWWRKNRRGAPASNPGCLGVDINRNFDFLWDYPSYFDGNAPISDSTDPCAYELYHGPNAVSEPETQNVVWLLDSFSNIRHFIDVHSYAKKILYPWGDDDDQATDPNMNFLNAAYDGKRGIVNDSVYREYIGSCDQTLLIELGNRMRDAIQSVRGETYAVGPSGSDLYVTAGTSDDYGFSRHIVDHSKQKILPFTIEWGLEFQPPYSEMQNIIQDITAALLDFCLGVLDTNADVYIKDNVDDTGQVPYQGVFWDNSDIFVRQNDDNTLAYQQARQGQTNYVYVRVTNIGPSKTRDVRVAARAVRYPGTEFVYPSDWTVVDANHLEPTAIVNTFSNIAIGGFVIAKFSLSPSQVDQLWGWQSGGWHPCLLAQVVGCNDYVSPAGVHVWEDNNLAQRNISILSAVANEIVSFAFLVGNVRNLADTVQLAIDRKELPEAAELLVDPFDRLQRFDIVQPKEPEISRKFTLLDRARMEATFAGCSGILTLPPGASFEFIPDAGNAVLSVQGAERVKRDGRTMLAIREKRATFQLHKEPGALRQVALQLRIPPTAKPGDVYRVRVAQRDEAGKTVGGVTLEVRVKTAAAGTF